MGSYRLPSLVPVAGGLTFAGVDAGGGHTCGVAAAGAAYCWGLNETGQLGTGSATGPESCLGMNEPFQPCSTVPVAVAGGLSFTAVTVGDLHSCGVTAEGTAYCWGWNEYGQLGDGTTTQRLTPVLVSLD